MPDQPQGEEQEVCPICGMELDEGDFDVHYADCEAALLEAEDNR